MIGIYRTFWTRNKDTSRGNKEVTSIRNRKIYNVDGVKFFKTSWGEIVVTWCESINAYVA